MYTENDDPVPYDEYIQHVSEVIKATAVYFHGKKRVKLPFILMEPGRSIIAPAGITLYTVGGIKDIKNVRKYVSVDGGMGDNPRYILYESEYEAVVANNANAERTEKVTVAGKCCESGDILLKDAMMPEIKVGILWQFLQQVLITIQWQAIITEFRERQLLLFRTVKLR